MDTLLSLRVFREVVDSGSFVAAAGRLNLSTAMASKHVAHLESDSIAVRLERNFSIFGGSLAPQQLLAHEPLVGLHKENSGPTGAVKNDFIVFLKSVESFPTQNLAEHQSHQKVGRVDRDGRVFDEKLVNMADELHIIKLKNGFLESRPKKLIQKIASIGIL